jgi:hypothetical protein
MNPTQRYLKENKYAFSLRKQILLQKGSQIIELTNVYLLLKNIIKTTIICMIYYPIEFFKCRKYLHKTFQLINSKKYKYALVIGNGPSQGYLNYKDLDNFVKNGGETFCLNNWNLNKKISKHIPTYYVLSDPDTFRTKLAPKIIKYLKNNPSIKIVAPIKLIKIIRNLKIKNKIYGFIDIEFKYYKNLSPFFPRGYISCTSYKALAFSIQLRYKFIGIIGFDNSYLRTTYSDKNNRVFNLETHNGIKDFMEDQTSLWPTVAHRIAGIFEMFYHLEKFPKTNILNLDIYSLTDRFKKVKKNIFFNLCKNNNKN